MYAIRSYYEIRGPVQPQGIAAGVGHGLQPLAAILGKQGDGDGAALGLLAGPLHDARHVGQGEFTVVRITSYNVCYTKLLRDTLALIQSLRSGQLGAAVLDVFEQEPLPASHPLWELPNVIITPHNSAWSAPDQVCRIFERNYLRFLEDQQLEFLIDMQQGY